MSNRSGLIALSLLALAGPAAAEDWRWSVTPYLWATDVGAEVSIADLELVDTTLPFEDLVEDLEAVVQLQVEARRGHHGAALDIFFVDMASEGDRALLPGESEGALVMDSKTGMTLLDAKGIYTPRGDGNGFAFLYGVRVMNQSNEINLRIEAGEATLAEGSIDTNDTFLDGLIGIRYSGKLGERWFYQFAADASTGDTEFTWSVNPMIGYAFGERSQYQVSAGYRHLVVEYETNELVDARMSLSGALIGFTFAF